VVGVVPVIERNEIIVVVVVVFELYGRGRDGRTVIGVELVSTSDQGIFWMDSG